MGGGGRGGRDRDRPRGRGPAGRRRKGGAHARPGRPPRRARGARTARRGGPARCRRGAAHPEPRPALGAWRGRVAGSNPARRAHPGIVLARAGVGCRGRAKALAGRGRAPARLAAADLAGDAGDHRGGARPRLAGPGVGRMGTGRTAGAAARLAAGPAVSLVALGLDLVDVARARRLLDRYGDRALTRLLTEGERRDLASRTDPAPGFAARLAAKEAAWKALQTLPGARG